MNVKVEELLRGGTSLSRTGKMAESFHSSKSNKNSHALVSSSSTAAAANELIGPNGAVPQKKLRLLIPVEAPVTYTDSDPLCSSARKHPTTVANTRTLELTALREGFCGALQQFFSPPPPKSSTTTTMPTTTATAQSHAGAGTGGGAALWRKASVALMASDALAQSVSQSPLPSQQQHPSRAAVAPSHISSPASGGGGSPGRKRRHRGKPSSAFLAVSRAQLSRIQEPEAAPPVGHYRPQYAATEEAAPKIKMVRATHHSRLASPSTLSPQKAPLASSSLSQQHASAMAGGGGGEHRSLDGSQRRDTNAGAGGGALRNGSVTELAQTSRAASPLRATPDAGAASPTATSAAGAMMSPTNGSSVAAAATQQQPQGTWPFKSQSGGHTLFSAPKDPPVEAAVDRAVNVDLVLKHRRAMGGYLDMAKKEGRTATVGDAVVVKDVHYHPKLWERHVPETKLARTTGRSVPERLPRTSAQLPLEPTPNDHPTLRSVNDCLFQKQPVLANFEKGTGRTMFRSFLAPKNPDQSDIRSASAMARLDEGSARGSGGGAASPSSPLLLMSGRDEDAELTAQRVRESAAAAAFALSKFPRAPSPSFDLYVQRKPIVDVKANPALQLSYEVDRSVQDPHVREIALAKPSASEAVSRKHIAMERQQQQQLAKNHNNNNNNNNSTQQSVHGSSSRILQPVDSSGGILFSEFTATFQEPTGAAAGSQAGDVTTASVQLTKRRITRNVVFDMYSSREQHSKAGRGSGMPSAHSSHPAPASSTSTAADEAEAKRNAAPTPVGIGSYRQRGTSPTSLRSDDAAHHNHVVSPSAKVPGVLLMGLQVDRDKRSKLNAPEPPVDVDYDVPHDTHQVSLRKGMVEIGKMINREQASPPRAR